MLRIAIVDDEEMICRMLTQFVQQATASIDVKAEINRFANGNDFIKHLSGSNSYHLIFLDIEMEKGNGLDVSKYIRNELCNYSEQIVFITGKTGYEEKLFDYQPFHFIRKPIERNAIESVIAKYLRIYGRNSEIFNYKQGHITHWVPLSDIVYFESSDRKVKMFLYDAAKEEYAEFYGSIEKVHDQLSGMGFFSPHKSFVVNYRYIRYFFPNSLVLYDNTEIPIAKSRKKDVARIQLMYENGGFSHADANV